MCNVTVLMILFCLRIQVYYGWRKVTEEFVIRMDPKLPSYYHTSLKCRFYEGQMPDFSQKPASKKTECLP